MDATNDYAGDVPPKTGSREKHFFSHRRCQSEANGRRTMRAEGAMRPKDRSEAQPESTRPAWPDAPQALKNELPISSVL